MILDLESEQNDIIDLEREAIELYGLIHARYITTKQGLQAYKARVVGKEFGTCPRYGKSFQRVIR